jgi:predicted ATP-grasp superfamily ATP-dependent carboligase
VSRGVRALHISANPLTEPEHYARQIANGCERLHIEVLLPVTDASSECLLRFAALLPARVRLPLPSLATFRLGTDKAAMQTLAADAGFSVPRAVLVASVRDMPAAGAAITLPAIVKPHRSVGTDANGKATRLDVLFVDDSRTLDAAVGSLPSAAYPVMVQERIVGDGEGCFALRWRGQIVACFAHRRLREKPPAGGISVYRESIAVPETLRLATERLLEALDWNGVAMIECKRDAATGRHVFIELNGRLWGSLQLAIDAGVDFPAMLVALAVGDGSQHPAPQAFVAGVRSQWFWGDVDHLYARLSKPARELHLGQSAPGRLATLLAVLKTSLRPSVRAEVGRWRDPLPALLEWTRRLTLSAR